MRLLRYVWLYPGVAKAGVQRQVCMARKQDSPEVTSEKALAVADYASAQRRALRQLERLRQERLQREAMKRPEEKKRAR